jgi:hypothetical protein
MFETIAVGGHSLEHWDTELESHGWRPCDGLVLHPWRPPTVWRSFWRFLKGNWPEGLTDQKKNNAMKRMFGSGLHHHLCAPPGITGLIKWKGTVVRLREMRNEYRIFLRNPGRNRILEDPDLTWLKSVEWIVICGAQMQTVVSAVVNLRVCLLAEHVFSCHEWLFPMELEGGATMQTCYVARAEL